jgi:hypothetical protein
MLSEKGFGVSKLQYPLQICHPQFNLSQNLPVNGYGSCLVVFPEFFDDCAQISSNSTYWCFDWDNGSRAFPAVRSMSERKRQDYLD